MGSYIFGLFVLAVKTIWWLLLAAWYTGPWIMDKVFEFVVHPLLGSQRLLRMSRWSTVPLSSVVLGALWGGLWLLFWGALGVPEFGWWGVAFGVIAGWKAGDLLAREIEQIRLEITLEEHDQPTSDNATNRRIDNQDGEIDFDDSMPQA